MTFNINTLVMKAIEEHNKAYKHAKKRVEKERSFFIHLVVYIVINIAILFFRYKLLLLIDANTRADENFIFWWRFGTLSTPLGWGIGLLFHYLWTYKKTFLFNKKWENKKIKELMEKEDV